MSLGVVLFPLAVSVLVSAAETAADIKRKCQTESKQKELIKSRYNDSYLLQKTLEEHGVQVNVLSENHLEATLAEGKITYVRQNDNEPFYIDVSNVGCMERFLEDIDQIDSEYGCNVQSYTYDRVMQNIPDGMYLESEQVLEDNSILLTLTVD